MAPRRFMMPAALDEKVDVHPAHRAIVRRKSIAG
jgi:hypothetical protein